MNLQTLPNLTPDLNLSLLLRCRKQLEEFAFALLTSPENKIGDLRYWRDCKAASGGRP
jgi:hypothetical protein